PLVLLAAHKRFVSIIPQEFWPTVMDSDSDGASGTSGEVRVRIQGHIIVDQSRFGLKFYGGDTGAAFDQTFTFQLNDAGSIAGDLPYRVARNAGEPAGVIEISRLAAPNPTMLPSWNQIGFDSLHYLAGFVESDGHRAVLWVIPGKLDEATGETVVAPELKDRFALNADYANGLLSMHAYTPFLLSFIGSWDMPFAAYRLSTRVNPTTGAFERHPELNALVLGDELEFYGKFLKIMGMTDFWTGHMPVFGGANADRWHTGQVRGPTAEVGTVQLTVDPAARQARLTVQNGRIKAEDHVVGLLLINAETGRFLPAAYARGMRIESDADGYVTSIELPLRDDVQVPKTLRAYYMVDTYPARRFDWPTSE
ncbi:MAG: hypothetical protein KDK34_22635, partial [Leptospiraceae bacterium]|nr:hypothetical protein [Leptospiraceae bacterium]